MNFQTIKKNFDKGLWNATMVKMAVRKGVITQEECDAILTGKELEKVSEQEIVESIMQGVAEHEY